MKPQLQSALLALEIGRESQGDVIRGIFSSLTILEDPQVRLSETKCFVYLEIIGASARDHLLLKIVESGTREVMRSSYRLSDDPETHHEWLPHTAVVPLTIRHDAYGRHEVVIECAGTAIGSIRFEVRAAPKLPNIGIAL